ncbi:MAG: LTA synthase family protein [Nitrospirae bacterium]|nr:MAG: LTA synthase family protein [Nitrospirota bacterium]
MCTLVFWGVLFLLIQQTERLFLLPETAALERPTTGLLTRTLGTGLVSDIVSATGAVAVGAVLGGLLSVSFFRSRKTANGHGGYRAGLNIALAVVGCLLLVILIVDVGYYGFSQQHVNFVFFEYLDDLLHTSGNETGASQAAEQTVAELEDSGKWGVRIGTFLLLEGFAIAGWWAAFTQKVGPMLAQWETRRPVVASVALVTAVVSGAAGLGPFNQSWSPRTATDSEAYFNLAQNPLLFAREPLRDAFLSQWSWVPRRMPGAITVEEAVQVAQEALGQGARFPFPQYPLVKESNERVTVRFDEPVNVVLIFVEGLDRRYLDRTIDVSADSTPSLAPGTPSSQSIRLTPFLDRLKDESLYFENFFSNGVATTRALFATFCSYYPRQGTAALKTRYEQDYLCVPSLLRKGGFRTEMVIGLDSDIPGIRPFMARNGLDRFYGERDFPEGAERLGVGLTDGALFGFMRTRIETLQTRAEPFFLAALTSSMHHPFTIPLRHPEVRALQQQRDRYIPALRYFDLEFERFFTGLQRDGLLRNTIVFVLGDHGRHEPVGTTDVERQGGRFLVPLFIWLDESLRTPDRYRPRHIERIASQVDLAPTILALNGLMPRVSAFMGRDLTCLFVRDCLRDNFAYLSSVYDDLIGLADQDGLWLYSFRRGLFQQVDLHLKRGTWHPAITATDVPPRSRRLLALYLAANMLLERNQIWSWKDLGGEL